MSRLCLLFVILHLSFSGAIAQRISRSYQNLPLSAVLKDLLTILNGTNHVTTMPISRYREVIGQHRQATNIVCGCNVDISKDIQLQPRETLILEL